MEYRIKGTRDRVNCYMKHRPIGVYEPWISQEDVAAVTRVAATGWISSAGPEVGRFEQALADYIGTNHAISVMNGTAALHLALMALGIGDGDEVIVPDLTFVATAASVVATGAKPVFADITRTDWNIDPSEIERLRGPRTRALLAVHLYGNPLDAKSISANLGDLILIEDVAEALGASVQGRKAGSFGAAATFSFYGNKTLTTGEGGMIVTDNTSLADRMRLLRDHAMSRERRYFHEELGWNYRMTAMQAAIGLSQMHRLDEIIRLKQQIASRYAERLAELEGLELHPLPKPGCASSFWMYSILLPDQAARDGVARDLALRGIETRPFFIPMSQMPPFQTPFHRDLPVSSEISSRGLNLPSGPLLSELDQDYICDALRRSLPVSQAAIRMPAA
jgi:perosamine synthetase